MSKKEKRTPDLARFSSLAQLPPEPGMSSLADPEYSPNTARKSWPAENRQKYPRHSLRATLAGFFLWKACKSCLTGVYALG